MKKKPQFEYKVCMACAICVQACPVSCLDLAETSVDSYKKAYPLLQNMGKCTSCGICEKNCPIDAVRMM